MARNGDGSWGELVDEGVGARGARPGKFMRNRVMLWTVIIFALWLGLGIWWRVDLDNAKKSHIEGDVLYLPKASDYLAEAHLTPSQSPFYKFDGNYAPSWPEGLELPPDTYLLESSSLPGTPNGAELKGMPTAIGVTMIGSTAFVAELKSFIVENEWELGDQTNTEPPQGQGYLYKSLIRLHSYNVMNKLPDGSTVNARELKELESKGVHATGGWRAGEMSFAVKDYEAMDGWTYFELQGYSTPTPEWTRQQTESKTNLPPF